MAIDLVNGTDAAIANYGGGTLASLAARSYAASVANTTDAQAAAGVQANGATAALKAASTDAQKAAVAFTILDNLCSSVDLSTAAKRKAFKLKKGVAELYEVLSKVA